ncbi:hypothetical protein [Kitasatospora viridis]|uniref:Uncharacterized protein n=1 Tax=Kitasatospora viridis TaxID=281105 RepID=A0A561UKQ0_9ACTN|nr:hypothetical protein [Kitasatospora viridis]TWF99940.1 hypothetical protein FHX73_113800 [Kitasatospora viridis]
MTTDQPSNSPALTAEQHEQLLQASAQLGTAVAEIIQAAEPALRELGRQLAELLAALQQVGLIDADGHPTHPANRPAWQSPYGPPRRR